MAEEPLKTVANTADIISNVTLLSPATWPISISFRAISGLIGGGSSQQCNDSNILTSPYCAIVNVVVDIQKLLATQLVNFGQNLLTINTNSDLLTQASSQNNVIVQSGWGIVRNIANAALVIGLIIIAITIILGYQENKAKQLLVNFIIIALLINFTPVICGFIIDGSNILTSSFLAGGTNTNFVQSIEKAYSVLNADTGKNAMEKLVEGTIYFIFAIIAAVIMCLYALLFMARTAILWILVIVSPVAFATKVFPQSKYIKKVFPSVTYWDDWWESFVQWTVISIPAAISLYISIQLMSVSGSSVNAMTSKTALDGLMAFATPFIFMIAGFFITISSGGSIAGAVGTFATGYLWGKTGGRVLTSAKETAERGVTIAKEGVAGIGGALISGKSPLNFENREEGRRVMDKLSFGGPNPKDDKENAQEYLKSHPGAYSFQTREGLKKSEIKKDAGDYIDSAKTLDELRLAIRDVETLGNQKSKDAAAISLAGKRKDIPGSEKLYQTFISNNKIDLGSKISKMNDKTAQKELGKSQLENYEVFKNMNPATIAGLMKIGSDAQKKTLISNYGGGNSDFKAYVRDLQLRATDSTDPKQKEARQEFNKVKENILAVLKNKPDKP
ncbi:MAG: hypothetical protein PHH21_02170 [Candidatus Pacebacteria bacterium]|nr:hypothetical protein [Candidatus Paceibacterota bacterium]